MYYLSFPQDFKLQECGGFSLHLLHVDKAEYRYFASKLKSAFLVEWIIQSSSVDFKTSVFFFFLSDLFVHSQQSMLFLSNF